MAESHSSPSPATHLAKLETLNHLLETLTLSLSTTQILLKRASRLLATIQTSKRKPVCRVLAPVAVMPQKDGAL
jgi:hypothetical protein